MKRLAGILVMAASLAACNLGSYDDAVDRFNAGRPPAPPPGGGDDGGGNDGGGTGFNPVFSEIQASVFTPNCATAGCHSGANPSASLNLEAANRHAMLVGVNALQDANVQRVNPGNPDSSYLITKLEGPGAAGQQMPPNNPMPQADIDVIRQWITDGAIDDTAQPSVPVRVSSLSPSPGATLDAAPASVIAGFDRDVDASTVNANTFILEASGGDGAFNNGNETQITAASITLASPRSAVFDLTGVALGDDTYQVTLEGTGASIIMDLDGNALDGEFTGGFPSGNGTEGGDFMARFTISTPVAIQPTLDSIQAIVFTPSCARSGCHDAVSERALLNLSDADTSLAQLVNIPATQNNAKLRVVPGDPDTSYLVEKLEGPGDTGQQMPPGGQLPQDQLTAIRTWITNGAQR